LAAELDGMTAPTLAVGGERDGHCSRRDQQAFLSVIA